MKLLKKVNVKIIISVIIFIICICIISLLKSNNGIIGGRIYFNKPVSWENAYVYIFNNTEELTGEYPGIELKNKEDYIYYLNITEEMLKNKQDINDFNIMFNDGKEEYSVEDKFSGYNKIYNITTGLGIPEEETKGKWIKYSDNISIGKIPETNKKIKNIIYMIGDGMGENHIKATSLKKSEKLNMQTIQNKSYVITSSLSTITDSAASATALATGHKTRNEVVGKNRYGEDVENILEYANSNGLKTGIICTQIINHATPAAFSVHNINRYNYDEIIKAQIKSNIDLILGGGRNYISEYENLIECKWINKLSELKEIDKEKRVIGTFAEESISEESNRIELADITKEAIKRLENDTGFVLMIEGSDIDKYSHEGNIEKTIREVVDFDDAVQVAMEYVDNNPETLLVVTADHETGGLTLDGVNSVSELTDSLFTSDGGHTSDNVLVYAYGNGANDLTQYDIIDNTSIYKFLKQGIINNSK